jgi:NADH-quinone oxidoreductase subunit L
MAISTGVALTAILLATKLYKNYSKEGSSDESRNFLWKLLWNKYYVDELYQIKVRSTYVVSNSILWKIVDVLIIDGIVNSAARLVGIFAEIIRRVQTGFVQNYAIMMLLGILAIIGWLVIRY